MPFTANVLSLFQKRVQVSVLLGAGHRHGGHDAGLPALGQRARHSAAPGPAAAQPEQPLLRPAQVRLGLPPPVGRLRTPVLLTPPPHQYLRSMRGTGGFILKGRSGPMTLSFFCRLIMALGRKAMAATSSASRALRHLPCPPLPPHSLWFLDAVSVVQRGGLCLEPWLVLPSFVGSCPLPKPSTSGLCLSNSENPCASCLIGDLGWVTWPLCSHHHLAWDSLSPVLFLQTATSPFSNDPSPFTFMPVFRAAKPN